MCASCSRTGSAARSASMPTATAAAIVRIANDKMAGASAWSPGQGPRPARLRAVRLRRRGPAARRGAGARAGHPETADPHAPRHHQRAGLRRGRPAPRLREHREQALPTLDEALVSAPWRRRSPRAARTIAREGVARKARPCCISADMQFQGQSHILTVRCRAPASRAPSCRRRFAAAYWERFGIELPEIRPCWSTCTPR
jgi:N-methylhydantoinase A